MESLANRVIARLTNTRSDERTVALLMFAYSFLAMMSHNILKPVTKSKFIDQLGSDNLPYVLMASSVLVAVVMHGYSGWIRRLPRQYVIPIAQSALVVVLVLLWGLLRTGAVWVTVALYFFGQILGVLLISQFWTLANEVYDARQAKRLFGLIGGGACLGGALGASITAITVQEFGSNNLLLISAATLSVCVVIVLRIVRHSARRSCRRADGRARRRWTRSDSVADAVPPPEGSRRSRWIRRHRRGAHRSATQYGGRGHRHRR